MFLIDDPLIRQLLPPLATFLLGLMGYIMNKYLSPQRIQARISQETAPPSINGNGYLAAITIESKRVDDLREDVRDDIRSMKAEIMDKINWLSVDLHESIDAQNIRIARMERTIANLVASDPLGSALLREVKRGEPSPDIADVTPDKIIDFKPSPHEPPKDA